jgi:hypothetical protein
MQIERSRFPAMHARKVPFIQCLLVGGTFWRPDFDPIYVGELWSSTGSTLTLLQPGDIMNVKTNVKAGWDKQKRTFP